MYVDEDNGKSLVMVNGQSQIFRWFSSNECWKNIGRLFSASTFGIGGPRLWDK